MDMTFSNVSLASNKSNYIVTSDFEEKEWLLLLRTLYIKNGLKVRIKDMDIFNIESLLGYMYCITRHLGSYGRCWQIHIKTDLDTRIVKKCIKKVLDAGINPKHLPGSSTGSSSSSLGREREEESVNPFKTLYNISSIRRTDKEYITITFSKRRGIIIKAISIAGLLLENNPKLIMEELNSQDIVKYFLKSGQESIALYSFIIIPDEKYKGKLSINKKELVYQKRFTFAGDFTGCKFKTSINLFSEIFGVTPIKSKYVTGSKLIC